MIEFRNVSKSYQNNQVLQEINLTIYDGEIVVLIGPSGCGKTTTLKMINRLTSPSSGEILINGENILEKDPIALRRSMGYVIQQTGLFPHMTVRQNIEVIPRLEKRPSEEISQRTLKLMEMVDLNPAQYLDRYPIQLSGGQLQRVGVARAFATDPDIILMDEPFSALDPITRAGLQDALVSLQSRMKKTIVFVTHDMDEAVKIADRICIMYQGHILQYDKPEAILKNPAHGFVSEFVGKNRIWSSPEYIRADDIMITSPVTTEPDIPMFKCIEKMRLQKVNSLMVVDSYGHLLGIVKAAWILRAGDREGPVEQVMRKPKVTARPETSIVELLQMVRTHDISSIPVVDRDEILKGLVTNSSLVTTLSNQFLDSDMIDQLEEVEA